MTIDISERGLERLICTALTGSACDPGTVPATGEVRERPAAYDAGWLPGDPADYDHEYCVDLVQLTAFLHATQAKGAEALDLDQDSPTRRKILVRLQGVVGGARVACWSFDGYVPRRTSSRPGGSRNLLSDSDLWYTEVLDGCLIRQVGSCPDECPTIGGGSAR